MEVFFDCGDCSDGDRAKIDEVLRRIQWKEQPAQVRVVRRLAGGRSASDVFEIVVRTGSQDSSKVLKVGPFHDLAREWRAFESHLSQASSSFAPIQVATPAVRDPEGRKPDEPEGVVYDHAARFSGRPTCTAEPLESFVRDALRDAACEVTGVDRAVEAVTALFRGVRNDLYEKYEIEENETSCLNAWNLRLGSALVISVDGYDAAGRTFTLDAENKPRLLRPLELAEAALRHDGDVRPGDLVEVRGLKAAWWGDRLMGQTSHALRLEIVCQGRSVHRLAHELKDATSFGVRGIVHEVRARTHRERLLAELKELTAEDGALRGKNADVPDPFAALPQILEAKRPGRIRALVHGDLNPRNVLMVEDSPVLIDYAFTRPDEPFFLDFTRLEGCLARDTLPSDLTWAQHVRLQRLLGAACRLNEQAVDRFVQLLADERADLAAAFRVLWAIRAAARDAYPPNQRDDWMRDYLEQLFLFAHLTLKWDDQTEAALRASAAMAAVAAENLCEIDLYRLWSLDGLRGDGFEILRLADPLHGLRDLAAMTWALRRPRIKDDRLSQCVSEVRTSFVQTTFADDAKLILAELEEDHGVYIELRGQRSEGRRRKERSFREMLEDDVTLAQGERLRFRDEPKESEDVFSFLVDEPALVLIGDTGAGKSTVMREWRYRLLQSVAGLGDMSAPRFPIVVRAPDLRTRIGANEEDDCCSVADVLERDPQLLYAGALHVTVDALNELPENDKQRVAEWILNLRRFFPATPVVACHRQYNYTPGLLPFPVVTLDKVMAKQAEKYVYDYLRKNNVDEWHKLGQRLVRILLDDPEHQQVRDLAQTPLFLWMIVDRYRDTRKVPSGRGALFEDFSRWYLEERHHEDYDEPVKHEFSFDEKAAFLGRLGYALVERGATDLIVDDDENLVDNDGSLALLEEIVESEMLLLSDGKLRFLHQSFQEYFAARHFLEHEVGDAASIRAKVWTFGWHDTFAVLLGFSGGHPEIVGQVIQAALEVNPLLTARCLRIAEQPGPELLERFVKAQETVLRDSGVGKFYQARAADALAEHGRGPARAALLRIAADPKAPPAARTTILELLPRMPKQARFEPVAEKMHGELQALLGPVLARGDEAEEIHVAAVDAVASAGLRELSDYLSDFLQDGNWGIRKAAWRAYRALDLELTPRHRAAFVRACEERLQMTEVALYAESIGDRMDELNGERVEILRQLATPVHLPVLLRRRFAYRISEAVRELVDQARDAEGEPPEEARTAWRVLLEEHSEDAVENWWRFLREDSELTAAASAHRLVALGEKVDTERLRYLLGTDLSSDRLAAVAELVETSEDQGLAEALEELIRGLMKVVEDLRSAEAFTCLLQGLTGLEESRGRCLTSIAELFFIEKWREEDHSPGGYPFWRLVIDLRLRSEDHQALLARGGDDARASIMDLQNLGGGALLEALPAYSISKLDEASREHFWEIAAEEGDPNWRRRIAKAAAELKTTNLLPQLVEWVDSSELAASTVTAQNSKFGAYTTTCLSDVLRSIGYLARLLRDDDRIDEAEHAIAVLHARAADLPQEEDRSLVAGLTTALGYLGEWEPLLTYLRPGEPWMHCAADNVFTHWVPMPPDGLAERERAARWIVQRLRKGPDLAPETRSTLGQLLERLELEIGHHVRPGDEVEE